MTRRLAAAIAVLLVSACSPGDPTQPDAGTNGCGDLPSACKGPCPETTAYCPLEWPTHPECNAACGSHGCCRCTVDAKGARWNEEAWDCAVPRDGGN